jgi:hypothetical protein
VSEAGPLLDRGLIEDAFRRLGDRLARRSVVADIYVFGGAAMALAYDARRATRDIDAVFEPHGIVLEEARIVADELGLSSPTSWASQNGGSTSRRVRMSHPERTRRHRASSTILAFVSQRHLPSTCWR